MPRTDLLHICPACSHELVHPLDWVAEGPKHWRMNLRCPDCGQAREGLFTQEEIDAFADELDRGEDVLLRALEQITAENMKAAAERFIGALNADLIGANDFQR
jgi:hypothetical protein